MKSLCYLLALNAVFSAATALSARNASNESQLKSGKVKHTISRIFSIPKNQARTAHNDKYYNQLMKILTGEELGEDSKVEASETNTELTNADILLKNAVKDAYLKMKSQDDTKNELNENVPILHLKTNKNANTDNVAPTEETELNADALHEILQKLKAYNVSNLDRAQFRKGKLVIYYGGNEGSSENPTSVDASGLNIENLIRIEDEIHNLFTQHEVPEKIFYGIKRLGHFDAMERIKNLITAFIKYKSYKGHLNSDIINKLKIFIADNNIDMDILKLLMTTDSIDLKEAMTPSPTDSVSDVIKSILDYSDVVKTEKSVQISDVTTILNSAVTNGYEQESTLRDIVHYPQDVVTTKDSSLLITNSLMTSEANSKVLEDSMDSNTTFNENEPKVPINGSHDKHSIVSDTNVLNLPISGLQDGNIILSSEDVISEIRTQLNRGIKKKTDFETLKKILNGTIHSTYFKQIDPNVPVFSNIPIEEYINYNNKNPFLIYVVFPESDKPTISDSERKTQVSEDIYKIASHFIEQIKNQHHQHESSGEFDLNSEIIQIIKDEIAKQKRDQNIKETIQHRPDKTLPDVVLDLISQITDRNITQSQHSERDVIESIMNHFYKTREGKKELNTEAATDKVQDEIDIIKELLILFPNITTKPARKDHQKNIIELLEELLFNSTQTRHDTNTTPNKRNIELEIIINSITKILQTVLNEKRRANEEEIISEEWRIYQLIEKLIVQIKYLQRELEKRNFPQQTQRTIIEKELRNAILKITTDSVTSCVERANKSINLSIQKVLSKSLN